MTVPTDEGGSMPLDKGKTQERADGWYWVKWGHTPSIWAMANYDSANEEWSRPQLMPCRTAPLSVGPRIPSPDEPAAVAPHDTRFEDHVKHVQEFLQQMYAIMIDPVEDATGTVADTCRLLLNAARRDRETINHLMIPKVAPPTRPAGLDVEALLELCEKATPGPWTTHKMEGHTAVAANTLIARVFSTAFKDLENERVNAHLISAARTALPLALQHLLALEREIAGLRADRERLVPRQILTGGNHLATLLIGYGLPVEDQNAFYAEVLQRRGATYADIWACWSAIMRCRDAAKGGTAE